MNIKKKFYEEKYLLFSLIAIAIVSACHWIQFARSDQIQPLVRAICSTCYIIVAIFLGKKCWSIMIFIWALAILYFNRFYNYTSFVMVLIACGIHTKKIEKPAILIYIICVGICLFLYKDSWTHLVIHGLGCYFFYSVYEKIKSVISDYEYKINSMELQLKELKGEKLPELILTEDEENIIKQLAVGREIKQIEGYCTNTIYTKLREARIRNNLLRNCQLIEIYIKQK